MPGSGRTEGGEEEADGSEVGLGLWRGGKLRFPEACRTPPPPPSPHKPCLLPALPRLHAESPIIEISVMEACRSLGILRVKQAPPPPQGPRRGHNPQGTL